MIYFGDTELLGLKIGNTDISAVYAGDLLIWPTSVTGWSVTPSQIEVEASGGSENIKIASLSAWTISSSESWVTFSQNSGDSGRTTVTATIASHTSSSSRTATITVTDGTNVSTISVSQEAYENYASQYFTMEILTAGTIVWKAGTSTTTSTRRTIQYSKNNGAWTSIKATTGGVSFSVSVGDIVRFKGTNTTYSTQSGGTYAHTFSSSTASFNAYGNIMSLISGDNFQTAYTFSATYVFRNFFNNTNVLDASNLVLPATALTEGCYMAMFGSAKLQRPPKLPATVLAKSCYFNMFLSVSALTEVPELPATALTENCYRAMFYQCTNITTAPDLPAPALATNCVYQMFDGCTKLSYIKCLATSILSTSNRTNWVRNVASSGTFVKSPDITESAWGRGVTGIPNGWTVINNS